MHYERYALSLFITHLMQSPGLKGFSRHKGRITLVYRKWLYTWFNCRYCTIFLSILLTLTTVYRVLVVYNSVDFISFVRIYTTNIQFLPFHEHSTFLAVQTLLRERVMKKHLYHAWNTYSRDIMEVCLASWVLCLKYSNIIDEMN